MGFAIETFSWPFGSAWAAGVSLPYLRTYSVFVLSSHVNLMKSSVMRRTWMEPQPVCCARIPPNWWNVFAVVRCAQWQFREENGTSLSLINVSVIYWLFFTRTISIAISPESWAAIALQCPQHMDFGPPMCSTPTPIAHHSICCRYTLTSTT